MVVFELREQLDEREKRLHRWHLAAAHIEHVAPVGKRGRVGDPSAGNYATTLNQELPERRPPHEEPAHILGLNRYQIHSHRQRVGFRRRLCERLTHQFDPAFRAELIAAPARFAQIHDQRFCHAYTARGHMHNASPRGTNKYPLSLLNAQRTRNQNRCTQSRHHGKTI